MRTLTVLLSVVTVAATTGVSLGHEFWSMVGPNGQLVEGSQVDLARVTDTFGADHDGKFVAFWMTTQYGEMYEKFGQASYNEENGKYCGYFSDPEGAPVTVCSNFRILSNPERYRGQTIFEWVLTVQFAPMSASGYHRIAAEPEDAVGYNDHRAAAQVYGSHEETNVREKNHVTFGDLKGTDFTGFKKYTHSFDIRVLRLLVPASTARQHQIPNLPPLVQPVVHHEQHHHAHRHHQERHQQQQQTNDDAQAREQEDQDAEYQRRLREYNERLQQHRNQQVQQQPVQQQQQLQGSFVCDTYGRVFEIRKEADGRSHYAPFDVALHGGVRPPCTLIGESPSGGQVQQQQQPVQLQPVQPQPDEQRPQQPQQQARRGCSRQKRAAGEC